MASFVTRAILCLIFGFLIYEAINEFNKLFGLRLNPYLAIVPAVLVYVSQEFVIKKLRAYEKASPITKPMEKRIDKVIYLLAWVLLACFFIVILVVWAGVIYKQMIMNM